MYFVSCLEGMGYNKFMKIYKSKLRSTVGKMPLISIIVFLILVVGIVFVNNWIDQQAVDLKESPKTIVAMKAEKPEVPKAGEGVVRKARVIPGNNIVESIFYKDGQEFARQTHNEDGLVDQKGTLPEGKIRFEDDYSQTYGTETYRHGKKEGRSEIYYKDGRLKAKINYREDKIRSKSEFYADGTLRFEVDYQYARKYENDKEVGVGKLYYSNGNLKYEWNMTLQEAVGFKKSYNPDGQLRHEAYFDVTGQEISKP